MPVYTVLVFRCDRDPLERLNEHLRAYSVNSAADVPGTELALKEGRPDALIAPITSESLQLFAAIEANAEMLLSPQMEQFHQELRYEFNDRRRYRLHYVTAREMVNIIHAAEDGKTGNPGALRDYVYPPPVARTAHAPS